jgi:hypothetical protein
MAKVKTTADGNPRLPAIPVSPQGQGLVKRGRGRPPVLREKWSKATVTLLDRQIAALGRLSADIRERTGGVVNRAALIRAAIEAAFAAGIDPSRITSEEDVRAALTQRFSGAARR